MNIANKIKGLSQNSQIIIKNTIGAFIIRGLSLIVSVLTTPAFIYYFNNNEVLGIWFTMLSILIWFLNFDLGIGNGLRNQLVKDFTHKDYGSVNCTLSSGFLSTGVVTLILTLLGCPLISVVNLNQLFNVDEHLLSHETLVMSSLAIFIGLMLRFFLTTITSIFYALQKSAVNNFLGLCIAILQLLYVKLFHFDDVNEAMINLAVAYVIISNLPTVIAGIWIFIKPLKNCRPRISYVTRSRVKSILSIGALFFICQILYMCIANTNEFLITSLYGANDTSQYTFYYKLMSIISMLVSLALTPVWSVVTKAVAERNYAWLKKLFVKIKRIGLLVCAAQFFIIPFMQPILDLWLGKGQVNVQIMTAVSFSCFFSMFVYSGMLSTIASGMARMKIQALSFAVGVVLKFTIDFSLYQYVHDWSLIVWSNVAAFMPYIIWQQIDLNNYFKKQIIE